MPCLCAMLGKKKSTTLQQKGQTGANNRHGWYMDGVHVNHGAPLTAGLFFCSALRRLRHWALTREKGDQGDDLLACKAIFVGASATDWKDTPNRMKCVLISNFEFRNMMSTLNVIFELSRAREGPNNCYPLLGVQAKPALIFAATPGNYLDASHAPPLSPSPSSLFYNVHCFQQRWRPLLCCSL